MRNFITDNGEHFRNNFLMDGDADPGSGNAPGGTTGDLGKKVGDTDKDKDKLLTQDQVNKILADHKRGLRNELDELRSTLQDKDTTIEELKASQEDITAVLQELAGSDEEGSDEEGSVINMDPNRPLSEIIRDMAVKLTDYENVINELNQGFDERINDLETHLESEAALREVAEEDALISERDAVLQRALIKAGCIDTDVGLKLFEDLCEIDSETGDWWIVDDRTGEEFILSEGIEKFLPDYLKKPLTAREGAGSRGGITTTSDVDKMKIRLTELDGEIITLQKEYGNTRSQSTLLKAQQMMKEKNQLQRDLRAAKI
jgi:hypothetical protein